MRASLILIVLATWVVFACNDGDGPGTSSLTGKGGSLARFATNATHLYAVDEMTLNVYQIMPNGGLAKVNEVSLGNGVETLAANDHWLYIGTNDAMLIYSVEQPSKPTFVSQYLHIVACDPVVVQDTLAFVTVRTSNCRPTTANSLDIINIKNPVQPTQVSTYSLTSPYGLGVDGNLLFVCEGSAGLTVFDITDPYEAKVREKIPGHAFDVIANDGVLILTGNDGIVQYGYSPLQMLEKLSVIPVVR